MDLIQESLNDVTSVLNELLSNPYVSSAVTLFIVLYSGLAAPDLPPQLAKLFDFPLFKIFILALILFVNQYNPTVALLVAVGFFLSLQTLSRHKLGGLAQHVSRVRQAVGLGGDKAEAGSEEEEEGGDHEEDYGLEVAEGGAEGDSQVSGLAGRTKFYMGPQGMNHPAGYGGPFEGASY